MNRKSWLVDIHNFSHSISYGFHYETFNSPGILGFEMEKNNIKLKISGSVHYVLL